MGRISFVLGLLALGFHGAASAVSLEQAQLETVYGATYEVVVKKLDQDSLTYERALPLHLVPYAIRADDYWSMGTAFAIGPDTFVSAAHVFNLHRPSLYREFRVRDREGNVYTPDKVVKYSADRDFVVFTLKDHTAERFFALDTEPALNSEVFAVGNAHGEGIVIRDGRFTSTTPEAANGAWSWLRFSAAASPGNSGGPLLDAEGEVIGIVLRKSQNENLNYALPIEQVTTAPDDLARAHLPHAYRLEHVDARISDTFDYETALPLTFDELREKLVAAYDANSARLLGQLLERERESLFPAGEGSQELLGSSYDALFPHMIWRRQDGSWSLTEPSEKDSADLGKNGFIEYGALGNTLLFRIDLPEDVGLEQFTGDGERMMRYLSRAVGLSRTVGSERVRIVSLGKPLSESSHVDKYGRRWTLRRWNMEYDDSALAVMSLPTPRGSVNILRTAPVANIHSHVMDLMVLTDYLYLTYYGTLAQWQEYLSLGESVPAPLRDMRLQYAAGEALELRVGNIRLGYGTELQRVSDDSDLMVYMSYFRGEKEAVVWDVAGVLVGEDKNSMNYYKVMRNVRPGKERDDEAHDRWARMAARSFPYNMISHTRDSNTHIGTTLPQGDSADALARRESLYSVFYAREGRAEQVALETRLNRFLERLSIGQ